MEPEKAGAWFVIGNIMDTKIIFPGGFLSLRKGHGLGELDPEQRTPIYFVERSPLFL